MVIKGALIGNKLQQTDDSKEYIRWHKSMRINQENYLKNKNVLKINFEDLILNYNETISTVSTFLNLKFTENEITLAKKNIENSHKNIGLWKIYHNQEVMDEIYKALIGFDR
jgi:hypothetical protein